MVSRPLIPLKGGDEQDALTGAKQFYRWRPGVRVRIKRQFNKRFRKTGRRVTDD